MDEKIRSILLKSSFDYSEGLILLDDYFKRKNWSYDYRGLLSYLNAQTANYLRPVPVTALEVYNYLLDQAIPYLMEAYNILVITMMDMNRQPILDKKGNVIQPQLILGV